MQALRSRIYLRAESGHFAKQRRPARNSVEFGASRIESGIIRRKPSDAGHADPLASLRAPETKGRVPQDIRS